jgi:hypothetical protein
MANQQEFTDLQLDRRQFLTALAAAAAAQGFVSTAQNVFAAQTQPTPMSNTSNYLETSNGWYTHNGKAIWGIASQNQWWGGYRGAPTGWWTDCDLCPSLIRNYPGKIGLNRTEDFDQLTDSMLSYGYPGFEHTPPLWFDRRRDTHQTIKRPDGNIVGPVFEMPWARSNQGQAWDGLPLYDLTKFNDWYFKRLKDFADFCDRKGCILFFNFYNQHNLLETQAHYCDYPWRPTNCVQATDLPDTNPVANVFYDVTHALRRQLHEQYIRHCLDVLKDNRNVVLMTGQEFTGPLTFMQFWFDTILEWEKGAGRRMHIGLGATKDVVDAMLQDARYGPRVGTIDMRYWYLNSDGALEAPAGGQQIPGRYIGKGEHMTLLQVYKFTREYRTKYPDKAITRTLDGSQDQMMAFLMAGGSMIPRGLGYAREYPDRYEMPLGCDQILPIYDFLRNYLADDLLRMTPLDVLDKSDTLFCLGERGKKYLIYMPFGNQWFKIDLTDAPGTFDATWIGMRLGKVFKAMGPFNGTEEGARIRGYGGTIEGGKMVDLSGLDWRPWMLWLKKRA